MQNLSNLTRDKNFRALFVAPTGRGKTIAAASFPGRTLVIDADKRVTPVLDWYSKERLAEIDVFNLHMHNFLDDKSGKDTLQGIINGLVDKNPYHNILIDGITSVSNTAVMMQMAIKGNSGKKVANNSIPVPSWDEFNGEAMLVTGMLETLKGLNCNLIVTAHPVTKTNMADGTKSSSIVSFGTKLQSIIPGYFDECWYFDYKFGISVSEGVKRYVRTQPSGDYPDAKTSMKDIPSEIDITNEGRVEEKNFYNLIKAYL